MPVRRDGRTAIRNAVRNSDALCERTNSANRFSSSCLITPLTGGNHVSVPRHACPHSSSPVFTGHQAGRQRACLPSRPAGSRFLMHQRLEAARRFSPRARRMRRVSLLAGAHRCSWRRSAVDDRAGGRLEAQGTPYSEPESSPSPSITTTWKASSSRTSTVVPSGLVTSDFVRRAVLRVALDAVDGAAASGVERRLLRLVSLLLGVLVAGRPVVPVPRLPRSHLRWPRRPPRGPLLPR